MRRRGGWRGCWPGWARDPERVVAVVLERSAELVTAVLAVPKAGAAYLPVDPGYPAERVSFMLADSRAGVVVTSAGGGGRRAWAGWPVVGLDDPQIAAMWRGSVRLVWVRRRWRGAEHAAYVMYTSGSTGRAKGVVVTHRVVRPAGAPGRVCRAGGGDVGAALRRCRLTLDV